MKNLLFIFLFSLFLKADSYIFLSSEQITSSFCVKDYYFSEPDGLFYIPSSSSDNHFQQQWLGNLKNIQIFQNYSYDSSNRSCTLIQNNSLGMDSFQFNFLMALTGLLTSILLIFIIFLKV